MHICQEHECALALAFGTLELYTTIDSVDKTWCKDLIGTGETWDIVVAVAAKVSIDYLTLGVEHSSIRQKSIQASI